MHWIENKQQFAFHYTTYRFQQYISNLSNRSSVTATRFTLRSIERSDIIRHVAERTRPLGRIRDVILHTANANSIQLRSEFRKTCPLETAART